MRTSFNHFVIEMQPADLKCLTDFRDFGIRRP